jgi:hypothetical protein
MILVFLLNLYHVVQAGFQLGKAKTSLKRTVTIVAMRSYVHIRTI